MLTREAEVGEVVEAASRAQRLARGLTVGAAAKMAFVEAPATGALRAYAVLQHDGTLVALADGRELHLPSRSLAEAAQVVHALPDVPNRRVDLFIEAEDLAAFGGEIDRLPDGTQVYLGNLNGLPWRVSVAADGSPSLEYSPSVLVRVGGLGAPATVGSHLALRSWSFTASDVSVLAFFDRVYDAESVDALEAFVPAAAHDLKVIEDGDVRRAFAGTDGKLVLAIGHHEGGSIVVRRGLSGPPVRLRIDDLVREAERRGVYLMVLGCRTACYIGAAGLLSDVNSIDLVSQLRHALRAPDFATFLEWLPPRGDKLVIDADLVEHGRSILRAHIARTVARHVVSAGPLREVLHASDNRGTVVLATPLVWPSAPPAWQRWLQDTLAKPLGTVYGLLLCVSVIAWVIVCVTSFRRGSLAELKEPSIGALVFAAPLALAFLPARLIYVGAGVLACGVLIIMLVRHLNRRHADARIRAVPAAGPFGGD